MIKLRYVIRDGEKVLQYRDEHTGKNWENRLELARITHQTAKQPDWIDVPIEEEE
jgi:hypothetical protein